MENEWDVKRAHTTKSHVNNSEYEKYTTPKHEAKQTHSKHASLSSLDIRDKRCIIKCLSCYMIVQVKDEHSSLAS